MKRIVLSISTIIIDLLFIHSCIELPSAADDPYCPEVSLIPGECLINDELDCVYCNRGQKGLWYIFGFTINVDIVYDVVKASYPMIHRHMPTDNVFKRFEANAKIVKKQYEEVWSSIDSTESTFFYAGDIILTADVEFAGIPAGENLSGLLKKPRNVSSYVEPFSIEKEEMLNLATATFRSVYGPNNDMDSYFAEDYRAIPLDKQATITYGIPSDDYSFTIETVNFTLQIPIKSAQYLTWLNDKLTDENAQMTWKEEVLTCSFSSNTGLRLKE